MLLVAMRKTGAIGRRDWVAIGALTYPLYLMHQNIGLIAFNRMYPRVNAHVVLWGTVAAMLALAYAIHVRVEERLAPPMRGLLNRWTDALESAINRRRRAPVPGRR